MTIIYFLDHLTSIEKGEFISQQVGIYNWIEIIQITN